MLFALTELQTVKAKNNKKNIYLDFITVKYKKSFTRLQVECQKTLVNFELIDNGELIMENGELKAKKKLP